MKIVHVQTLVQTTFGVLDDDGNVIAQRPIQAQIGIFSPEAFTEAFEQIKQSRDQASADAEAQDGGAVVADRAGPKPQRGSRAQPER